MKNTETTVALTKLARECAKAVDETFHDLGIGDQKMWDLARRLHLAWRTSLREAKGQATSNTQESGHGHPAMEELLRLIDMEAEQ